MKGLGPSARGFEAARAVPALSLLACPLFVLAVGAALAPLAALAQSPGFDATAPLPGNPGRGQVQGSNGLPALRANSGGGDATSGDPPPPGLRSGLSGAGLSGAQLSGLDTQVRSGGTRTGGAGSANTAPTSLLRLRAAPPRRIGLSTRRITREATQVSPTALRLSPVVQAPVVGVPLPVAASTLGLITPGALLGNALRRPAPVDSAYAPLGLRLGSFTVLPAFTQFVGYDSNPDQTTPRAAKGSAALRSEGEVAFRSDWSAHELAGELRGGYSSFPETDQASRPNGAGSVRLRLDANRDLRFDVEGRFLVDTQRAGSPDLQAAVVSRPIVATYGTSVGATQSFNRLQVSLRGSVDRSEFEDARLSNGQTVIQSDRDMNQYGLRLRTAYEISPVVTPFVDLLADTRIYDSRRDQNGVRRDSDGVAITAGASFALTRFLTGEVSAGVQHRSYVDPTLKAIDAPLVNAALIWSASPLTTVRLNAVTGVTETSVAGSSGVLTDAVTLEVQHDLLRNLSITLGGALLSNDYQGARIKETGFSATARLDYRFNRWLTFRGSYIYQEINSSSAGSSFSDNTVLFGLRVNP